MLSCENPAYIAGQRLAARVACISTFELNRDGVSQKCGVRQSRCLVLSSGELRELQVRNGGKRSATACFLITTRTQKIAPRVRLIQCVLFLMRECLRHYIGARCPTAIPQSLLSSPCPSGL